MAATLSRRQFIARASRAGLGIGALALAGCDGPEVFNARRADDPQDRPENSASANEADGAVAERERTEPRLQVQPQAPSPAISAPPVPADVVDPLVWRERYHWRELAKLPGQNTGPVEGGSLHVHAPQQFSWTPFNPQEQGASRGTFLPLLYSQLLVMAAGDFQNAHRGEIEGDLAAGWEIPDPATLVFRIRRAHQPRCTPNAGAAATIRIPSSRPHRIRRRRDERHVPPARTGQLPAREHDPPAACNRPAASGR